MANKDVMLPIAAGVAVVVGLWLMLHERPADVRAAAGPPVADSRPPTPRARLVVAESRLQGASVDECALPEPPMVRRASGVAGDDVAAQKAIALTPAFKAFSASVLRIDAALRASPDRYANAVAIWLNVPRNETDDGGVPESERRRQLATMAVSTTDPRIYAMAFHACRQSVDDGCHALNARRWAELDAGNAMPWMYLLDEATKRGDVSGQEEAWFHMAASARMAERMFAPAAAIVAASEGGPGDAMADYALAQMAVGIAAAQFVPLAGCNRVAPVDANRAQVCAKVADVMFEHSDSPGLRLSGAAMTFRATGDSARKALVAAETSAWAAAFKTPPANCEQLREQTALLASMATRGQQATLSAIAASSPKL